MNVSFNFDRCVSMKINRRSCGFSPHRALKYISNYLRYKQINGDTKIFWYRHGPQMALRTTFIWSEFRFMKTLIWICFYCIIKQGKNIANISTRPSIPLQCWAVWNLNLNFSLNPFAFSFKFGMMFVKFSCCRAFEWIMLIKITYKPATQRKQISLPSAMPFSQSIGSQ